MWARDLVSARMGRVGYMEGSCCYQAMSKLIIDNSMVGIRQLKQLPGREAKTKNKNTKQKPRKQKA